MGQINKTVETNVEQTKQQADAIARIVSSGSTVGFVLRKPNGQLAHVDIGKMHAICKRKLVSNIVIATNEVTGKTYLRGNGIKIEDLPEHTI